MNAAWFIGQLVDCVQQALRVATREPYTGHIGLHPQPVPPGTHVTVNPVPGTVVVNVHSGCLSVSAYLPVVTP